MYLSVCEEEEVTVAICEKKMTEDGGVNGEMERVISEKGGKVQGLLMLERLEHAAQRHCNRAEDRLIHMTTDSPALMLTWSSTEQTCAVSRRQC